ncbi:MAG: type II toxin-antitoxin system RelE/ParE family toxin [Sulfurovum sp.]|nr:type II toxin-antitoxin system RelE/ParE family toxin [Sulfurovum sp.]
MSIITTDTFDKNVKKIYKKDKLLYKDLQRLLEALSTNPKEGISLGNNAYKIRLQNSSSNRGKSGGYRVVSYFWNEKTLGLLTIYSKSERENIFEHEIELLIKELAMKVSNI